jgi:hypothetical protein
MRSSPGQYASFRISKEEVPLRCEFVEELMRGWDLLWEHELDIPDLRRILLLDKPQQHSNVFHSELSLFNRCFADVFSLPSSAPHNP